MIALIQRVTQAEVSVNQKSIGTISQGILALIGIEKHDTREQISRLLQKVIHYRIFADKNDRMNLSLKDINGGLLLVPQFTLAANTKKGLRPSFSSSAPPELAEQLFNQLVDEAKQMYPKIQTGKFGADMQVSLVNDGPVTFNINV